MPGSRQASGADNDAIMPRRVRHITAVHIANFTPFPVRDEFTSALSRPSEQPQYAEHGHLSDDLDLTLGRKRGRRRSSTILSNISSGTVKESSRDSGSAFETTPRRRTTSKPTLPSSKVRSPGSGPPVSRPPQRHRTISSSSSISHFSIPDGLDSTSGPSSLSSNGILRDTSQPALEKILSSRLVETFITIRVPAEADEVRTADDRAVARAARRNTISTSQNGTFPRPRRGTSASLSVGSSSSKNVASNEKSHLGSSQHSRQPSSPKPFAPRTSKPTPPRVPIASGSRSATPEPITTEPEPLAPDYLSPIHRPSVNPGFYIDIQSDFASGTHLSGHRLVVEVWAEDPKRLRAKGKGKEKAHPINGAGVGQHDWSVLETWDVDLNDLVSLPDKSQAETAYLSPNTLCIALDPPGQLFYYPQTRGDHGQRSRSRSPSPTAGYNSDPESNVRSVKPRTSLPKIKVSGHRGRDGAAEKLTEAPTTHSSRKGRLKTASWQDLLKLVNLQTVIRGTEDSLLEIVRDVETHVVHSTLNLSLREASEREARMQELGAQKATVCAQSDRLRTRLAEKSDELRKRREILRCAREAHAHDCREDDVRATEIEDERDRLALLRDRLPPIRNSLFTNLAFVFPIELLSPPDLLFTILDVPLPIPTGPTDPAPPLSLPSYKEINEDTVATALGYAAQVVQLLAAYLGQGLTYPVTCVGSRSLIKDGISMMVGPRMFPLFSKGVDTYRFEYGVFLLNKDIELLMTERNLRALDVRHTLPNLKNLLLTLTDPDIAEFRPHRPLSVASSTISALQSPVMAPTTPLEVADAPNITMVHDQSAVKADSPPPSGSTTPTHTPTSTIRKPRGFLDLSGFFRGRQPVSARSSVKAEPSPAVEQDTTVPIANGEVPQTLDEANADGDDDDDRRTIRASASDEIADRKSGEPPGNGHPNGNGSIVSRGHPQTAAEKAVGELHATQVIDGVS